MRWSLWNPTFHPTKLLLPVLRVQKAPGRAWEFSVNSPFPISNFILRLLFAGWAQPCLPGSPELTDLAAGTLQRIPSTQFPATLFLIYIADPNDGLLRWGQGMSDQVEINFWLCCLEMHENALLFLFRLTGCFDWLTSLQMKVIKLGWRPHTFLKMSLAGRGDNEVWTDCIAGLGNLLNMSRFIDLYCNVTIAAHWYRFLCKFFPILFEKDH